MGKRCTPAAAPAPAPAPAGSGWARAGLGWGLWDGGALARRCGPVKVGDYGAHTQASWASQPGKHALGDLGGLGSLKRKTSQATNNLPTTRRPGCSLLTASSAGPRHMSRCTLRCVAKRAILAQGLFPGPKNDAAVAQESPERRLNLLLAPSLLSTHPCRSRPRSFSPKPSNSQEASLSALIVPRPRGRASAASFGDHMNRPT